MILTQERLKELLIYNPDSGIFRWKINRQGIQIGDIAGSIETGGYCQIGINGKLYLAHRLAFLYMIGSMPENVDHINHDRFDNRWNNLREANRFINDRNRKLYSVNKTGIAGVHWDKRNKKWRAFIRLNKQLMHLYCGNDFFLACCARKLAEKRYEFHENHGK